MLASVYAPKDFKRLRAAGDVVARCFDFISPHIRAGISTGEIDRMVAQFLKENGARSSDLGYQGYPKHICTSVNDVIVHGIPSDEVILKDGDIVNVDLTAEYKGFHGDASRMFMIGNVTPQARKLVQVCQDALNAAISICAPGVPLSEIGKTIEEVVNPHGFSISRDFVGHGIGTDGAQEEHVMCLSDALALNLKALGYIQRNLTLWEWLREYDYSVVNYERNYDLLENGKRS